MSDRVRHKTFISYHHRDQKEVDELIREFDHKRDVFIARAVGSDETMYQLINSEDPDYVMRRIREDVLEDSTVTAVFIGSKTWTRKYVDRELAASLHQGPVAGKPNGLLAILSPKLKEAILPDRFRDNLETGYAKFHPYPKNQEQLFQWIEQAFRSREDEEMCRRVMNGLRKLKRNLNDRNDRSDRELVSPRSVSPSSHSSVLNVNQAVTGRYTPKLPKIPSLPNRNPSKQPGDRSRLPRAPHSRRTPRPIRKG